MVTEKKIFYKLSCSSFTTAPFISVEPVVNCLTVRFLILMQDPEKEFLKYVLALTPATLIGKLWIVSVFVISSCSCQNA